MAQVNLTLNQEEILLLSKSNNSSDVLKELLKASLNAFLEAESAEQLKAEPYERTEERTDQRNGVRERPLTTRIGTIELMVPRHRNKPFHTVLFENYQRNEAALITTMAEMVIDGVSTRKVTKVMEALCGKEFSKSTVSEACKQLDQEVNAFRRRPLKAGQYPFVMLDATYFKTRENHRITSKAFMVAVGITTRGEREVIGFDVYGDESNPTWLSFVQGLKRRGLSDVLMYTSDAHKAIRYAMNREYPEVAWQRCQFHLLRDILEAAPKKYKAELESELHEMFNSKSIEEARKRRDDIIQEYSEIADKAMETLDNGFEDSMTAMAFSEKTRRTLRTSNTIERLNGELKRRSNAIRIFPNAASLLRLMGSVAIAYHEVLLQRRSVFPSDAKNEFTETTKSCLLSVAQEQNTRLMAA